MSPLADRLIGLAVAGFGVVLLALIVPAQTETVDYGFLHPQTLPDVLGALLVVFGLAQAALRPTPGNFMAGPAARALGYLALAVAAVVAMAWLGFAIVAPVMVLAVMVLAGERRPLWLVSGTLVGPGLIWLVVVDLLDRTLPG